MILDASLLFDGSQSAAGVFTGKDTTAWTVSTNASTNVIDLGLNQNATAGGLPLSGSGGGARDIGAGGGGSGVMPQILVQICGTVGTDELYSSGGGTLNVQVQGAPDNGSGAPGSYVTMAESGVITLLTTRPTIGQLGYVGQDLIGINVPNAIVQQFTQQYGRPRFLRLAYVLATAVTTAGRVVAGVILSRDDNLYYTPGFTVAN